LVDPQRRLQDLSQRNDELLQRLQQSVASAFEKKRLELKVATESLVTPKQVITKKRSEIEMLSVKMKNHLDCMVEVKKQNLTRFMALLESLSPLKVVERGYSVVMKDSELLKSTDQVQVGDELSVRLMKGEFTAIVKEIKA
jgi:exodeoxyribonuclease VII large subunit